MLKIKMNTANLGLIMRLSMTGRRVAGAIVVFLTVAPGVHRTAEAQPASGAFLEKQDLFQVGDDPVYNMYHIPGIVVTARGSVLSWCEGRKRPAGASDWDDIHILLRRSTDDGKSWSPPKSIAEVPGPKTKNPFALRVKGVDPTAVTYNNPVLIADRDGTVHMLFCLEYMRCFYQRSTDDGLTWSAPTEITAAFEAFKKDYPWAVLATGPNHSIQLRTGRLIVPVWLSTGTGGNAHRPSVTATIYSDDQGKTWKAGEIAVPCTEEWINPNETVAVELRDGQVMLNVRSESKAHRRLVTISPDGATRWSTPKFDDALLEPICMGGIVRYDHGGTNLILFCNPHNLAREKGAAEPGKSRDRKNVSVKFSCDEGQTWSTNKSIEPGPSMYSDIAVTQAGTILCFYGRGTKPGFAGNALTLARFNLKWLTE
jgi:sialidase-1